MAVDRALPPRPGIRASAALLAALLCLPVSCLTAPRSHLDFIKPLVEPEDLAFADSLERGLRSRSDRSVPADSPWVAVLRGTAPIIITAPHATRPMRKGHSRFADRGTGAAAVLLHRVAGATVIYTHWASPCDPNDTDTCAFKDSLASLIRTLKPRLVLDLHASAAERPYDVDFGTMRGASVKAAPGVLDRLAATLADHGLTVQSLDFFKAEQQRTITRFSAGHGVPAIQLEVNAVWLRPDGDEGERQRFAKLINALARFIRDGGGRSR